MDLHVSLSKSGHLSADVYQQLKEAILDGRLRPGEALPATRDLARQLAVSRNTVMNAYQRLGAEGFLIGRVGAGTFVNTPPRAASRRAPAGSVLRPRAIWGDLAPPAAPGAAAPYDFQLGAPDPLLFPWDEWRRLVARELRGRRRFAGYPPPEGDPKLRAAIARHLGVSRSVRAGGEDVLVTSGAQQAFDLVARVLLAPGDCAAVEEPGYPPVRRLLEAHGVKVVGVSVDAEGIDVAALPDRARLVYVTPSHQFPLGVPLSLPRRLALLAWAQRRGAAILEDDYDSEFRFDGRPLEPLQSLDRQGKVIYVGTFSKVLSPTLRAGFVIAPASLMPALRTAKSLADSHGPLEIQRALAALLDEGIFARHTRRLLRVYRERREVLVREVQRRLGREVTPSFAGLHVSVALDRAGGEIERRARDAGIRVETLASYCAGAPIAGLALGYGLIPAPRIAEGIRRLAAIADAP